MVKQANLLFYLASPFTHPKQSVRNVRANLATAAAINLLKRNIHVFSPISYNANWSRKAGAGLPCEWPFWEVYDKNFLSRCDGFIILQVDGWVTSVGIKAETQYAKEIGLPVFKITMADIENGNLERIHRFIDKKNKNQEKT